MNNGEPVADLIAAGPVDLSRRDLRQRDLVPPQALNPCHALVIGVGAIGRQVALQLAALGTSHLTLVDFDTVAVENLAAQGYWPADLGEPKVQATARICRSIHPPLQVIACAEPFARSSVRRLELFQEPGSTIACFCCVDSMRARKLVWEAVRPFVRFWADGRMAAETLRVLASDAPATDGRYGQSLFDDAAAFTGACTARSTIYAASIAAGFMLAQFAAWLRGAPVEPDQLLNLRSCELAVMQT